MGNSGSMVLGLALGALLAGGAAMVVAGDLNPPAGAVTPTFKTIEETPLSMPVGDRFTPGDASALAVISAPGRYHLTSNIVTPSDIDGIRIDADGVILDLNGFAIQSVGGSADGITDDGAVRQRIRIHDGEVSGFSFGVNLGSSFYCSVERVVAIANGLIGVDAGTSAVVRDVHAGNNSAVGIRAGDLARIEGCVATGNDTGIRVGVGGVIRHNAIDDTSGIGIAVSDGSIAEGNSINNSTIGITSGISARVADNTLYAHRQGISASSGGRIVGNTLYSLTTPGTTQPAAIQAGGNGILIEDNLANNSRYLVDGFGQFFDRQVVIGNHLMTGGFSFDQGVSRNTNVDTIIGPTAEDAFDAANPIANTFQTD